jgi:isoleucyl-tRNA synthetase
MYKGYTIQPYSPKAGTGLSANEVNQPGSYRDVTDTTVVAQFRTPAFSEGEGVNSIVKAFRLGTPLLEGLEEAYSLTFGEGWGGVYFLAWTTTPWTLPSNTALTVGPKINYVLVKTFNQYTFEPIHVILAKNLVSKQFDKKFKAVESKEAFDELEDKFLIVPPSGVRGLIPYQIIAECKGSDLEGIRYEQLLPYTLPYQNPENAFRVICGDFVTTEDGTGIVHTAPTFGADDAKVAKEAKPEVPPMLVLDKNGVAVPLVDLQGRFVDQMGEFAGKYVKNEYYSDGEAPERSVDVEIAIKLKEENKAFKVEKYVHSYPHCWRTDKPILYYPLDSWFIKITEVRDRMFDLNETINWKPKATGEGRFGNWLKNSNDWNLSRSRYWGIPLPIWRNEEGTEEVLIGSIEDLYNEIEKSIAAGFMTENPYYGFEIGNMSEANYGLVDLHKNIVDNIVLVSPSGQPMKRESDLIDVWFDSGSMPYAQWHYPFENKEKIDGNESFPADFIAEGVDQTRGWFYTLHAIGTLVFDQIAYKNVVSNGLVLDKNGQKMSKRLGNAVDPFKTLSEHGPDATRWYMIANANPWDNLKFDEEGIHEVKRKFFGTLYNTYSFFSLYANIDGFKHQEALVPMAERPEIDRWILSELQSLIVFVDQAYEDYEPTKAARAISDFVQENLSNWYVRLCRRRFWKGDYSTDKIAAYQTLYQCMVTVSKLMAPVAPFYADQLFKDLNGTTGLENTESVHLTDFPISNASMIDEALEQRMQMAQTISSLVLSIRKKDMLKVRQPLQKVIVPVLDLYQKAQIEAVADLIKAEVNVKDVEILADSSNLFVKQIKPNFRTLGPKFGKDMGHIGKIITAFSQEDIAQIEKNNSINVDLNGVATDLSMDDVEITTKDIPGWKVASHAGLTVALDVTLNEDLIHEGVARELVNRIQNIRKDSGFEVTDKLNVTLLKSDALEKAILPHLNYIQSETLTKDLKFVTHLSDGVEVSFDDVVTKVLLEI